MFLFCLFVILVDGLGGIMGGFFFCFLMGAEVGMGVIVSTERSIQTAFTYWCSWLFVIFHSVEPSPLFPLEVLFA
ncbi:hypothetical protein K440DRAFT_317246 [Wilcoxina mikolae CBS 423.85]|nr:hypothetical protein K440DRAFT_317246 [Wilcoxina mikolae CBS 423.85]